MNLIEKIFGRKKIQKVEMIFNLKKFLEEKKISKEEILLFRIVRLEVFLKKAKDDLKLFLNPPKIKKTRKK